MNEPIAFFDITTNPGTKTGVVGGGGGGSSSSSSNMTSFEMNRMQVEDILKTLNTIQVSF